jgi:hypothetical protein
METTRREGRFQPVDGRVRRSPAWADEFVSLPRSWLNTMSSKKSLELQIGV